MGMSGNVLSDARPAEAFKEAFCPACIKAETIDEIADKVGKIYAAIYEGNGERPIMSRLLALEMRMATTNSGLMLMLKGIAIPVAMLLIGLLAGKVIK